MTLAAPVGALHFAPNGHRHGCGGAQQVSGGTRLVISSLWGQGGCGQDVDLDCNEGNLAKAATCGAVPPASSIGPGVWCGKAGPTQQGLGQPLAMRGAWAASNEGQV